MQEIRYDGTEKITENAGKEEILKAVQDLGNKTVLIHKPGSVITNIKGVKFTVGGDGKLHQHPGAK